MADFDTRLSLEIDKAQDEADHYDFEAAQAWQRARQAATEAIEFARARDAALERLVCLESQIPEDEDNDDNL